MTEPDWHDLATSLADHLAQSGAATPQWAQVFRQVPRHGSYLRCRWPTPTLMKRWPPNTGPLWYAAAPSCSRPLR